MRNSDAIYGGEMSAHHYFRDFSYCDSGIIPWLLVWEYLSMSNSSLSDLILEQQNRFPSSGELNFIVPHAAKLHGKSSKSLCDRGNGDRGNRWFIDVV